MIDNSVIELINREIDGIATASELEQLRSLVAMDPEIQGLLNDMRSVASVMAEVQRIDPPVMLKRDIMRAIEAPKPRKKAALGIAGLLDSLRGVLFGKPGLIFAGGIAAGFLLFLLTSTVLAPHSIGDAELTGTLVLTGEAPGFSQGQTINVNEDALKGTIETQYAKGFCLLRLNIQAAEEVAASVVTDPATAHLEAVRPSDESAARMSVREGEITLGGAREGHVVLLFSTKEANVTPARLAFISAGKTVFEGFVPLEKTK